MYIHVYVYIHISMHILCIHAYIHMYIYIYWCISESRTLVEMVVCVGSHRGAQVDSHTNTMYRSYYLSNPNKRVIEITCTVYLPFANLRGRCNQWGCGRTSANIRSEGAPSEETDSNCSMRNTCQGVWACVCLCVCALVSLRQSRRQTIPSQWCIYTRVRNRYVTKVSYSTKRLKASSVLCSRFCTDDKNNVCTHMRIMWHMHTHTHTLKHDWNHRILWTINHYVHVSLGNLYMCLCPFKCCEWRVRQTSRMGSDSILITLVP